MLRVLFVASEAYPLIKTGGLGDVCGGLPPALKSLGVDVRLLMPAYRDAIAHAGTLKPVARLALPSRYPPVTLLEGRLPGTEVKLWLVDSPPAYGRPGNPYHDPHGRAWPDNAPRFALLARAAVALALGQGTLRWRPQIVHCHDWQAGLVPALLATQTPRPATVFTIHNLAYQGLFPYDTFVALGLPPELWSFTALEFHGQLAFIKGGLAFADRLTTVSPSHAHEIQRPEFGHGLDGLLRHRASCLTGILNGIDDRLWNPGRDAHLARRYSVRRLAGKPLDKAALQAEVGLPRIPGRALLGMVSRLVFQKGIDLLLEALPELTALPLQLVILGTGEPRYESALRAATRRYARRVVAIIGYHEATAHRIQAGADMFIMPSRFEPCGLSQLYSLRYGTVPIVRRVGGLGDTVVDAADALHPGSGNGIVFDAAEPGALVAAVRRALDLYRDPRRWRQLMRNGMCQDFSWRHSAGEYLGLYRRILKVP